MWTLAHCSGHIASTACGSDPPIQNRSRVETSLAESRAKSCGCSFARARVRFGTGH